MFKGKESKDASLSASLYESDSSSDSDSRDTNSKFDSKSWTDDGSATTAASGKENEGFVDGMLNNFADMLNSFAASKGSSDDDDDDTNTDGDTDDESKVLSTLSNSRKRRARKRRTKGSRKHSLNDGMSKLHQTFSDASSVNSASTRDPLSFDESEESASVMSRKIDLDDTILKDIAQIGPIEKIDYASPKAELYRAIDTKNWVFATRCLKETPAMATYWVYRMNDDDDVEWIFLPIHAACFSAAPPSLVRELIKAYPKSIGISAPGDKLPLHIACETAASREVVSCLVNAFKESIYHVDSNGNTPLQLCVFSMSGKNRARVMKILTNAAAVKTTAGSKLSKFRMFHR